MKKQFVVVDTPFNRTHNAEYIGRTYASLDKVPSYTMVEERVKPSQFLRKAFFCLLLALAVFFIAASCASISDCPAYGASKKGTYAGYNSPYYRR